MKKIKVSIVGGGHSSGRGVGVYAENLSRALAKLPEINLTNKSPDLIHFPFFDIFFGTLPLRKTKPTVVTIHDLTPLVMSDRYPKGIISTFNLLKQWYSLRSVTAIVTDSENSKNDIVSYYRISPEKVFVTPLAVADDYKKQPSASELAGVKKKYHLPEKFILVLASGPDPNKNLPSLAEVTDRLGIPLVIVGNVIREIESPVPPELIDVVRLKVYNHIIFPGRIPNEEFNTLLHLASLYVHPSYYEGFGIPLLEAMTAGCLIATSNTSSSPEIYHEGAITFNPHKISSMQKAIEKALGLSPKAKAAQIELAKKRSKDFSWDKAARLTLAVYNKVLNG